MDEIHCSGSGGVGRGDCGHGYMARKPGEGVNNAFSGGFGDPNSITTVVAYGGA